MLVTCPVYDVQRSFEANFSHPVNYEAFLSPPPLLPTSKSKQQWLGFSINSPIGVAACAFTTGKGIALAAQLGYDILTYKTIRNHAIPAHPQPNIVYIDCPQELTLNTIKQPLYTTEQAPTSPSKIAIANSFGNSCLEPEVVAADIAYAKRSLKAGQVLIVSVYAEANNLPELAREYALTAQHAHSMGADIIELNLSCPNLLSINHDAIYTNPELLLQISQQVTQALPGVPILVKLGLISEPVKLEQILVAVARSQAVGITAINTIRMEILNPSGDAAFGENRRHSGVSGHPIRALAQQFITMGAEINQRLKLGLTLLGTGGITLPHHYAEMLAAGADIALSATGMMWNPYLARDYHASYSSS